VGGTRPGGGGGGGWGVGFGAFWRGAPGGVWWGGLRGGGGWGGTALIAPAMRALPVGLPKVLVSTVASGNVAPYVGASDIAMMYSVTDVAGLNRVSRVVLGNAAKAIAGMAAGAAGADPARARGYMGGGPASGERPAVGLTMFGVTTPCVTAVRKALEDRYDCLTFHATGTGGQAMEKLVESGLIDGGVIDVTTTEVADLLVGGVFACLPSRFDVILQKRVPYVLSVGALDMVNFGARETVPAKFARRKFHVHNPQVTLMRTTAEENRQFARFIAGKVNRAGGPFVLLIPQKGVSALDAEGGAFWDPEADGALFEGLENGIEKGPGREVRRLPYHVNDPEFAEALVVAFFQVARASRP
jgi:uncharacterized protein (UPF0261 family)